MVLGFSLPGHAAERVTLQPGDQCGKDALIADCVPCGYFNSNYGVGEELNSLAWTNNGEISNHRALLEFDLRMFPPGSIITSATLTLYYNPTSSNASGLHSTLSGSNESHIFQVTDYWDESTVSWATMPAFNTAISASLASSSTGTEDYNVDVTTLVQEMVNSPQSNFGMILMLDDESAFRCLLFASSDHPNASLHPKLVVNYDSAPNACFEMKFGECDGVDALIADCVPCGYYNTNYGSSEELNSLAWTNNGDISNHRSLLRWDLSGIPYNAIVNSAYMDLYFNPSSTNAGGVHSQASGSNESYLERIIDPWDEHNVSWANQPGTTQVDRAVVPASISPTQDYLSIDVTALVQAMVSNPADNFGFMLRLATESYYRCLLFASSDHPNEALHPALHICYSVSTSVGDLDDKSNGIMTLTPNPTEGAFGIHFARKVNGEIRIYDEMGKLVISDTVDGNDRSTYSVNLAKGNYSVVLIEDATSEVKRLIIQ